MYEEQFRQPHFLAPNHHRNAPSYICCIDTEATERPAIDRADVREQRFRLGTATRCRIINGAPVKVEHLRFDDPSQFWTWLYSWKTGRATPWLFAHNLGYDLTLLEFWKRCESGEFYFSEDSDFRYAWKGKLIDPKRRWHGVMVIDDPPTILSWRRAKRTFRAVDTLNYWPMSLRELGAHVGITKQVFPGCDSPTVTLSDYCANDTAILFRAVLDLIRWWTAGDYGKFGSTSAALAWSAFRHKFYTVPIHIHGSKDAIDIERAAYYGGRVEAYYCGPVGAPECTIRVSRPGYSADYHDKPAGPVYVLDVQSAYPAIMRHCRFPCRLLDTTVPPTVWDFARQLEHYGCVAHVTLKTERPYPRRKEDGSVSYPVGEFSTTLAGPELSEAIADGQLRKVHACAWYEMDDLFSGFVGHFWMQRSEAVKAGDTAQELFVKTILNSLYGKFAQRKIAWEDQPDERHEPPWDVWCRHNLRTGELSWLRAIAGRVQKKATRGEWWDSFPAIAAYVTSFLRTALDRMRKTAGQRNVYYQDTDSLHCTRDGYDNLVNAGEVHPGKLGALRLVSVHQSAHYYGLKHYELDGEITQAGIPSKAEVTPEGTVKVSIFERTRSIVSRSPDGCVRIQEREITRSDCHPRGVVGIDGWVAPERITEGDSDATEDCEAAEE
jgi:hypothetical protein